MSLRSANAAAISTIAARAAAASVGIAVGKKASATCAGTYTIA